MVALALEALGITAEVEIHIDKRLPVQGGLGAGSANAVAALVGLEAELGIACQQVSESAGQRVSEVRGIPPIEQNTLDGWGTRLSVESAGQLGGPGLEFETWDNWIARRLEIAAQVGSDVPLFLIGGTVLGLDRGQKSPHCPTSNRSGAWWPRRQSASPPRRPFATGTRSAPPRV